MKRRSWAIQLIVSIGCLPARSGSIFEGELGDAGLVEFAEPFCDHATVLLLGCARERQIKTGTTREIERDAAVLRRMCGGEKASVLAVLHIFAIGFEHARGRASL